MGFFDEILDRSWLLSPHDEPPRPSWCGPPSNVIPAITPLHVPLVRDSDLAIWLGGASAFDDGVALDLHIRWQDSRRLQPPFVPGSSGRSGLCLGMQTTDGHRLLAQRTAVLRLIDPPDRPILATLGARYERNRAIVDLWLWPAQFQSVTWIVEWRQQRVTETRVMTDLRPIAELGHRAETLWPAPQ